MSTPAELLVDIAPEFDNVDTSGAIAVADMQIAPTLCGDKRPLLVAYLAAHILTIGNRAGGATGSIASVTEAQASITYTNKKGYIETSSLANTSFGEEFDRLRRGCLVAMRTRVNCICRTSLYGIF